MAEDAALRALRDRVLDEDASVAGLLRTCVMLGASTGSDELRAWARAELHGYGDEDSLPGYRKAALPLYIDSIGGNMWARGQQISVLQVPRPCRDAFPDQVEFRQSVEELVEMANSSESSIPIMLSAFPAIAAFWSNELPMFQQIHRIYYHVSRSTLSGMVGVVRTTLVELVADITSGLPVDELPSKGRVDAAVSVNVFGGSQDSYNVKVGTNSGVIGQGTGSSQKQTFGVTAPELTAFISQLRIAASELPDESDRADIEHAVDDFESAVSEDSPDLLVVDSRMRMLRRLGSAVGGAFLGAVSSEAAELALAAVGITA
ncbi:MULTISPECIES: hypothetical protein [unclassified Rhodococcus (in: high G+C Gram-positive bacteria)]|uniref:AbiTii domain-containing protein n=1 Tax=unclassified Rhodococcus (in: high G+C Gram-positive bacteria) TaxID=192944 RepID=UPI000B9B17E6|nr:MULTISPECIES: hypothetical protein [unclassified Rhodococcus (in: high G+C Gram-positive bacteria)]OZE37273.1 hypothetical protein CH259_10225 [Rhodococcus sp. 05-2254-4]OZE45065.1 hypothetical protein CH261_13675 [Rhodococcus sp. 05-2254-3]OZE45399.1 hypothetical protein CH283_23855 [Rhodococcus sp. 05-2254-2]